MDGIITLLKPPGMTSSNAVFDVRRISGEKRAGHLGTLDPGAAGVLPICLGRATRLFDILVDKEKTYLFEIAFGAETDTQDAYGARIASGPAQVREAALLGVLPTFTGTVLQTAPLYSALKVDGKKMCDLARAGETVEQKTRTIQIPELTLVRKTGPSRWLLRVRCSRGTYVRTLCADIGRRLHTCAYMSMLLRTASGPFTIEQSRSVQELAACAAEGTLAETVMSCEDALTSLPALTLPAERRIPVMNGLESAVKDWPDGPVRLYSGGFLGVGQVSGGSVKLTVHLNTEQK